ncbi:MAG: hypothetical protein ABI852_08955 [Gemmatimonadaceae bacterium]
MWFIQTSVDALALPTDSVGRTTLTGSADAWNHLVRDNSFDGDERSAISNTPLKWSIWAWQQLGRRVQLHDAIAAHEPLAEMVRAEPMRACVFARFPKPGKRQADNTLELIVVVPPEQFARYETLVQFAMTLPSGHVSISVPSPLAILNADANVTNRSLITPGTNGLVEGLEMVVARGQVKTLSKTDLRSERRSAPTVHAPANLLHDDGDDWLLFAADRQEEVPELEDSRKD